MTSLHKYLPPKTLFPSYSESSTPIKMDSDMLPRPAAMTICERPFNGFSGKMELDSLSPVGRQRFAFPDEEIASDSYARFTTAKVPACPSLQLSAAIPLVCMLQPFAVNFDDDCSIPLAFPSDGVSEGLFRCKDCKAFVNPQFYWFDRKVRCNFCLGLTDVPGEYFSSPNDSGIRSDKSYRAELHRGSYDFVAPLSGSSTSPPVSFFAIDSSYYSLKSKFFHEIVRTLRDSLDSLPIESEIAIVLFNTEEVVFVRFDAAASLIVMRDLADPFLPGPASSFFVSPHLMKEQLVDFLTGLLEWTSGEANAVDVCVSVALDLGCEIVSQKGGGSAIIFQAGRDGKSISASNEYLIESSNRVCVDLFVDSAAVDFDRNVDKICLLVKKTGGNVYSGTERMEFFLRESLFFNCILKLRVSKGLTVAKDTRVVPRMNSGSVMWFEFSIAETLDPISPAYFQLACIFTRTDGVRLIRIHNLAVNLTRQINSVFKHAHSESIIAHLGKQHLEEYFVGNRNRGQIRDLALQTLVAILFAYRTHCATGTHSGQLILPDSLKTLPLLVLGFLKLFDKPLLLHRVLACSVHEVSHLLVARIFDSSGRILPASRTKMDPKNIYVFDCLDEIIVSMGREVPPAPRDTSVFIESLLRQKPRPVKFSKASEAKISDLLIEDSGGGECSYIDWLCLVHKLIQEKIND